MRLLIIFSTLFAATVSYPTVKTWTLNELSFSIEKSEGDPAMRPYLIDALNQIMYALFTGTNEESVHAIILSPSGHRKWTIEELRTALDDQDLSDTLRPYYRRSYHYLVNDKPAGAENEVEVVIPALDISTWSVTDVFEAMEDPNTKLALKPFLEKAKEEIKEAFEAGEIKENVTLVTPVGLVPLKSGTKPSTPTIIARNLL